MNEVILYDRIEKIKNVINQYGEDNFYLNFSGGKDSTVLHYLLDMALPDNNIPRVFINTGIEYNDIVKFVKDMQIKDNRIVILKPTQNIRNVLEEHGYPFKSKEFSNIVNMYYSQKDKGYITYSVKYRISREQKYIVVPKCLEYLLIERPKFKISDLCCYYLKKKPFAKWSKQNNKSISITGMRSAEGGRRRNMNCIIAKNDKLIKFHPLAPITEEWEDWFIEKYNIKLCKLYYPPFSFKRTGCKGCPFNLDLQEQLSIMQIYLPNERKQCEIIWKPVYDEYRRIGYRLKKFEQQKLF